MFISYQTLISILVDLQDSVIFAINTINYMVTVNIFFIETTTIIWLQLTYFLSRQLQLTNLIKGAAHEQ